MTHVNLENGVFENILKFIFKYIYLFLSLYVCYLNIIITCCLCCVCFRTKGTYGAAVTFVCGEKEKDALDHFAAVCNMRISQLPGNYQLLLNSLLK